MKAQQFDYNVVALALLQWLHSDKPLPKPSDGKSDKSMPSADAQQTLHGQEGILFSGGVICFPFIVVFLIFWVVQAHEIY